MGWNYAEGVTTALEAVMVDLEGDHPGFSCKIRGHRGKYFALDITTNGKTETIAMVVESQRNNGEYWYKFVEETDGPISTKCPLQILNLLSPTTDSTALEWRARCKENLTKLVLNQGDVVTFKEPLRFNLGGTTVSASVFQKVHPTRQLFRCIDNPTLQFVKVTITKNYLKNDCIESIKRVAS